MKFFLSSATICLVLLSILQLTNSQNSRTTPIPIPRNQNNNPRTTPPRLPRPGAQETTTLLLTTTTILPTTTTTSIPTINGGGAVGQNTPVPQGGGITLLNTPTPANSGATMRDTPTPDSGAVTIADTPTPDSAAVTIADTPTPDSAAVTMPDTPVPQGGGTLPITPNPNGASILPGTPQANGGGNGLAPTPANPPNLPSTPSPNNQGANSLPQTPSPGAILPTTPQGQQGISLPQTPAPAVTAPLPVTPAPNVGTIANLGTTPASVTNVITFPLFSTPAPFPTSPTNGLIFTTPVLTTTITTVPVATITTVTVTTTTASVVIITTPTAATTTTTQISIVTTPTLTTTTTGIVIFITTPTPGTTTTTKISLVTTPIKIEPAMTSSPATPPLTILSSSPPNPPPSSPQTPTSTNPPSTNPPPNPPSTTVLVPVVSPITQTPISSNNFIDSNDANIMFLLCNDFKLTVPGNDLGAYLGDIDAKIRKIIKAQNPKFRDDRLVNLRLSENIDNGKMTLEFVIRHGKSNEFKSSKIVELIKSKPLMDMSGIKFETSCGGYRILSWGEKWKCPDQYCANDGFCRVKSNGRHYCECSTGYTRQYCDINLWALLVLPILFVIAAIMILCCCLYRRKQRRIVVKNFINIEEPEPAKEEEVVKERPKPMQTFYLPYNKPLSVGFTEGQLGNVGVRPGVPMRSVPMMSGMGGGVSIMPNSQAIYPVMGKTIVDDPEIYYQTMGQKMALAYNDYTFVPNPRASTAGNVVFHGQTNKPCNGCNNSSNLVTNFSSIPADNNVANDGSGYYHELGQKLAINFDTN